MPGELWSEGRAVIGLDFLNGEGKMLADFAEEVDGGLGVVVVVDAQDAKSGGFINGCELVKAPPSPAYTWDELHIELYTAAWNRKGSIWWFRAWPVLLERNSADVMAMKDFQDGGG
jgi:hypothetical protein